jgi:hypothetical protein
LAGCAALERTVDEVARVAAVGDPEIAVVDGVPDEGGGEAVLAPPDGGGVFVSSAGRGSPALAEPDTTVAVLSATDRACRCSKNRRAATIRMTKQTPSVASTIRFIFAARLGDTAGGGAKSDGRSDGASAGEANHVGAVEIVSGDAGSVGESDPSLLGPVCSKSFDSCSLPAEVDSKDIVLI